MNLKKLHIFFITWLFCASLVQAMTLDQSLGQLKGKLVLLKDKLQTLRKQLATLAGKLGGGGADADVDTVKIFKADILSCLPKPIVEKVLSLPKTKDNLQAVTIYHDCKNTEELRNNKTSYQNVSDIGGLSFCNYHTQKYEKVYQEGSLYFFPSTPKNTFHVIVGEQPDRQGSNYCGYHALFNAIHFVRYFTQVDFNNYPQENTEIYKTISYFSEDRGQVDPDIFLKKMVVFKKEICDGLGLKSLDASSSDLSPDYFKAIAAQDLDIQKLINDGHFIFLPEATEQGIIDLDPGYITDVVAPSVDFFKLQKNAILTWAIGFNSTIFNGHFGTVCLVKQKNTLYEFVCDSFNTYALLSDSSSARALIRSIVTSNESFIPYYVNKIIHTYTNTIEQDYYLLFQKLVQLTQNKKIGEVRSVVSDTVKQALLAKINKQIKRSDGTEYPCPVQNYNHLGRPSVVRELFNDNQYLNIIDKQDVVKNALAAEAAWYVEHLPDHAAKNATINAQLTDDFKAIVRGAGRVFKRLKILHKIKAYFDGGNLEPEVNTPDGFFDEFELEDLSEPDYVIKSFDIVLRKMSAVDMSEYNARDIHPDLKKNLISKINQAMSTTYKNTLVPEEAYEKIVDRTQKAAWVLYAVRNYLEQK